MEEKQIDIVPFGDDLAGDFFRLNMAWVIHYFVVEPFDELVLSQPRTYILDKGGAVYFAIMAGKVVGTFALIPSGAKEYELSKMAVDENFRGKNIGNAMLAFCLPEAKRLGANKLILFSNTILQPAIHLYYKFGFKEVPLGSSVYKRSNIKMEIDLTTI